MTCDTVQDSFLQAQVLAAVARTYRPHHHAPCSFSILLYLTFLFSKPSSSFTEHFSIFSSSSSSSVIIMAASAPGDGLSDIDSEGDLMLKVGGELGGQHGHTGSNGNGNAYPYRLLRVSSKIMMSASPMFKTMLKAERFLEGSLALSIEQPPQLDFPEDEPEAFTTLCRIIHHKQGLQDPTLFKSLHGLAILSDKYGCLNNIKPWFTFCLNQKLLQFRAINMEDLPHLISAAYLFDDSTAFYGLTMTAAP
ncbi:hypothetical protein EDD36DRAFT_138770 [Exophiala viscosa]|uniref:BTB domain-containing protein n=1 Tax=Exophiala viscosa TaxID=2486360 RepID=A0AAN6IGE3_9EURO|nr:hypothetical protein EDD36DRAFT_138770 [Exophiala viscosa]